MVSCFADFAITEPENHLSAILTFTVLSNLSIQWELVNNMPLAESITTAEELYKEWFNF